MNVTIKRIQSYKDFTIGLFYVDFFLMCFTLEDEHRTIKIKSETRIPAGRYKLVLNTTGNMNIKYKKLFSFHKGMLEISGIPNFSNVYIHIGNDDDDTAGCPLVGMSHEIGKNFISKSTIAYKMIYPKIANEIEKGNNVFINVVDL
jgi:hypothetical protein